MYRIIKRYFRVKGTKKRLKKVISQDRAEVNKACNKEKKDGVLCQRFYQ